MGCNQWEREERLETHTNFYMLRSHQLSGRRYITSSTLRSSSLNFRKTNIHRTNILGKIFGWGRKRLLSKEWDSNDCQAVLFVLDSRCQRINIFEALWDRHFEQKIKNSSKQVFKCTLSDRTKKYLMIQMRAISVVDEKKNKFAGNVNLSWSHWSLKFKVLHF